MTNVIAEMTAGIYHEIPKFCILKVIKTDGRGMEMSVVVILLVWFIAPIGELAVIIGLLVSNDRHKRRIRELEQAGLRRTMAGGSREWQREAPGSGRISEREPESEMPENTWRREPEPLEEAAWTGPQVLRVLSDQESDQDRGQDQNQNQGRGHGRGVSGSLGVLSLILGVIFIVLAGLIFATTTWQVLPDTGKVFLVLAGSALFFGVSLMAEKLFHIHKTANAFYVLGSAFLFLTVLAAAYFELLGPGFILDKENRWKVLWVGSLVLEAALFTGLKRFHDRIYTQASLWGTSVSMFFLAKAFSVTWGGFVSMMAVYASLLIIIRKFLENEQRGGRENLRIILADGFCSFALIQFWVFGGITAARGLFADGLLAAEVCMGESCGFLDEVSLFSFTLPGLAAMAALMTGLWVLKRERAGSLDSWLLRFLAVEAAVYGAGLASDDSTGRMLIINLIFLGIYGVRRQRDEREDEKISLFWDICGCLAMMVTAAGFCNDQNPGPEGLAGCLGAFLGYYLWFYRGSRQWPHLLAAISLLPVPFAAWSRLGLTFDQLGFGVAAVLLISGIAARYFTPILKEDHRVQGGWRADWFQILSIFVLLAMTAIGDDRWRFAYTLLAALHFCQYRDVEIFRKPALSASACLLAAAFWQQPFISWPQVLELEMTLLPAACLIRTIGAVWGKNPWLRAMQTLGYMTCLFLLCRDTFLSGQVTDALIAEGICLAIFLRAMVKKNMLWARTSVALMLLVVIFLTRDFWLSLSWWIYLLAAGAGLITFAAFMEKKERL